MRYLSPVSALTVHFLYSSPVIPTKSGNRELPHVLRWRVHAWSDLSSLHIFPAVPDLLAYSPDVALSLDLATGTELLTAADVLFGQTVFSALADMSVDRYV